MVPRGSRVIDGIPGKEVVVVDCTMIELLTHIPDEARKRRDAEPWDREMREAGLVIGLSSLP